LFPLHGVPEKCVVILGQGLHDVGVFLDDPKDVPCRQPWIERDRGFRFLLNRPGDDFKYWRRRTRLCPQDKDDESSYAQKRRQRGKKVVDGHHVPLSDSTMLKGASPRTRSSTAADTTPAAPGERCR